MDQEAVERLLAGSVADAFDGSEALVQLLTAVRAAPRPHELTGEAAAVRAFQMAQAGLLPVAAARPQQRRLAGLLGAKVALAALLVATTGGVALGAAAGTLGGADEATTPGGIAGGHPSPTAGPDVSPTPATSASGRPTDSPSLFGLCRAYRAEANENRRRALQTPRFAELVSAADGREKVPSYCDRLLYGRGNRADPSATGSDRPGGEPTDRVTGRPQRPPSTPTEPPTGPPVDRPGRTPR